MSNAPAKRILLVEDYADTRALYAEALRVAGYRVDEAPDGAQAIELASSMQPDLVLLDIGLPGMDGFEVAHELRARPQLDRVPIVLLSAYVVTHNSAAMAERASALLALPKPCSPDELITAVHSVIGGALG